MHGWFGDRIQSPLHHVTFSLQTGQWRAWIGVRATRRRNVAGGRGAASTRRGTESEGRRHPSAVEVQERLLTLIIRGSDGESLPPPRLIHLAADMKYSLLAFLSFITLLAHILVAPFDQLRRDLSSRASPSDQRVAHHHPPGRARGAFPTHRAAARNESTRMDRTREQETTQSGSLDAGRSIWRDQIPSPNKVFSP
jgi:hypothetical protein